MDEPFSSLNSRLAVYRAVVLTLAVRQYHKTLA